MQCKLRLILCGEHRFLCEIFCVYTAPIGYNEVIWRLIPLPPVSVLHKMASLDVGIWETPFIFMVAVASCFFLKSIYLILTIYFMVNPVVLLHVRFKLNVQSPSAFSYFQHHLISFIFLLCLSWACVVSSSSGQGSPPVQHKECKWLMRVRVVFMASWGNRCLVKCCGGSLPVHTAHPPCPPAVNTAL